MYRVIAPAYWCNVGKLVCETCQTTYHTHKFRSPEDAEPSDAWMPGFEYERNEIMEFPKNGCKYCGTLLAEEK